MQPPRRPDEQFQCDQQRVTATKIAPHGSPARAYIAYHKLGAGMDAQTATPQSECECGVHPSVFYLLATLLLTRSVEVPISVVTRAVSAVPVHRPQILGERRNRGVNFA